jgi:hypothetical protein
MKTVLLVLLLFVSCTTTGAPSPQTIALFRQSIITSISLFAAAGTIKEPRRQELVALVDAAGQSLELLLLAFQAMNAAGSPPPTTSVVPPPPGG